MPTDNPAISLMFAKSLAALLTVVLLIAVPAPLAMADTEEDGRIWLNLNVQAKLPIENLNAYVELQPRWREEGETLDQRLIRPALFYKINPQTSVWLGYANVLTHRLTTGTTEEDRSWQQFQYQIKLTDGITLQSRTRLEQRWLSNGDDVGHRLRELLRVTLPFDRMPDMSLVAWNEVFVNFNDTDWGAQSGFDQNRAFIGLGYTFAPWLRIEAGYLNQYVETPAIDRMNHVFATTISLSF